MMIVAFYVTFTTTLPKKKIYSRTFDNGIYVETSTFPSDLLLISPKYYFDSAFARLGNFSAE